MFFLNLVVQILFAINFSSCSDTKTEKFERTDCERMSGLALWCGNLTASTTVACIPAHMFPLWAVGSWGVCCGLTCLGCQWKRYEACANRVCDIQKPDIVFKAGIKSSKEIREQRKCDNCLVSGCFILACPLLLGKDLYPDNISISGNGSSPTIQVMTDQNSQLDLNENSLEPIQSKDQVKNVE